MRDSDTLPFRMWSGAGGPTSPGAAAGAHCGAASHAYAMRVGTFPADGEFAGSDPDLAFKRLIMEAGADVATRYAITDNDGKVIRRCDGTRGSRS